MPRALCSERDKLVARQISVSTASQNSPFGIPRGVMQRKTANAHSVLATFCGLNASAVSRARRNSAPSSSRSGFSPIVASAHSVLATFCGLNASAVSRARRDSA